MTKRNLCKEDALRLGLEGGKFEERNHLKSWLFGDLAQFYSKHIKGESKDQRGLSKLYNVPCFNFFIG